MSKALLNIIQSGAVPKTAEGWSGTPIGKFIIRSEQNLLDDMLEDIFGYFSLQIGHPHRDLLENSPISGKFRVGRAQVCDIIADYHQLPFASAEVDLVVICHALEFCLYPEIVIRESFRVLRPEGHLVVIGFNAAGPYGLRQYFNLSDKYPFSGNFVSVRRLRDWFAVLGMTVGQGCYLGYTPLWQTKLDGWWQSVFEHAGDRWWPTWGAVYMLRAIKRVPAMRRSVPKWRTRREELRRPLQIVDRVAR